MSLTSKDRLKHILIKTEYLLGLSPNLKVVKDLSYNDNEKINCNDAKKILIFTIFFFANLYCQKTP